MLDSNTIDTIRNASVEDRLRIIEVILHSLKKEIKSAEKAEQPRKSFRVRQFDLGEEVHVDREELYLERGL